MKIVVTFGELRTAMLSGWKLFAETPRHPWGEMNLSKAAHYVLRKNDARRAVHQRTVVMCIHKNNLEPYGETQADGSITWRWRDRRKAKKET